MKSLLARTSVLMTLLTVAIVIPTSVQAQGADSSSIPLTVQATPVSPSFVGTGPALAPVGVTSAMALAPVAIPQSRLSTGENVGKSRAMMGVGLAAIVVGILVGGDIGMIFMIGGGVVGLMGLYQYMR